MSALPPLYQLAVSSSGTWRARVFNLPAHAPGKQPTLPFLRALAAAPGSWRSDWQKDPEDKLTVLRLAGSEKASLDALLTLLGAHGIARAVALGPVVKRRASPASS